MMVKSLSGSINPAFFGFELASLKKQAALWKVDRVTGNSFGEYFGWFVK